MAKRVTVEETFRRDKEFWDRCNRLYGTPETLDRQQLEAIRAEVTVKHVPSTVVRIRRGLYSTIYSKEPVRVPAPVPAPVQSTDQIENPKFSLTRYIPNVNPNHVPFGNSSTLEKIIKSDQFFPVFITGPTGTGKSQMVEYICAKHKKPLIRINLNNNTNEDVLIGSKTLKNGNIEVEDGPMVVAMRAGAVLLLDEIDAGNPNALLCLQPILEGKPYYFPLTGDVITPTPGFNIVCTANTKGKGSMDGRYIGTNVLNEAFLERFAITLDQKYPNQSTEVKILSKLLLEQTPETLGFIDRLVSWADTIRKTFDSGGCDETMTTRRLTHIVRAYNIFKSETDAITLACNRFDDEIRLAFLSAYKALVPTPTDVLVSEDIEPVEPVELVNSPVANFTCSYNI